MEQILANGLYLGAKYTLIALALSRMNVLNFAHQQIYGFGGCVTHMGVAQWGLPFVMGQIALAVMEALIEMILFRAVIRRSKRDRSTMLLAAGIAVFADGVILLIFGEKQRDEPKTLNGICNWGMKLTMPYDSILIGVPAITLMPLSKTGAAMRALAPDRVAAHLMGVDVDPCSIIRFALAALLAIGSVVFCAVA